MSGAVLGAAILLALAGCGKPVLRVADASLGDYYSEEEFRKLSPEQREEYCRELAEQRESYQAQIGEARGALEGIERDARVRRGEADSLRALVEHLEERLADARAGAGKPPAGDGTSKPERYVVEPGDSLWKISGLGAVYGRPGSWRRLFEANRDRIRDADRIFPGQEIDIPR